MQQTLQFNKKNHAFLNWAEAMDLLENNPLLVLK